MRFIFSKCGSRNRSGVVLLVTLWILVILTLFAIGIGYRASLELRLSRYNIDSLKTFFIATAGIQTALAELEKDTQSPDTNNYDTIYECGVVLNDGEVLEDIFKDILVGDGYLTIKYQSQVDAEGNPRQLYGMLDEERKVNINTITSQNHTIIVNLFRLLDIDADVDIIAASIVDWHDSNSTVTGDSNGAEDDYYMNLEKPYYCKNSRFQNLEELLLVRGMTQGIFDKIKDFITIYPIGSPKLQVNVNTASEVVLLALSRACVKYVGATQADADSLIAKIIDYRAGDDTIEATEDDKLVKLQELQSQLNTNEKNLFIYLSQKFFVDKSNYFRVRSQGISTDRKITTNIEAVLDRNQLISIYWRES